MAQKFVSLDEAATQLGITKDRLNELREDGRVRAYRDGASWKFRADDVEKLASEGLPADASSSDLALSVESESAEDEMPALGELSDIKLDLGDEEPEANPAASDLSLEDLDEPTLPVEGPAEGEVLEL